MTLGRIISPGGGGAGRAFFRISAWLCFRIDDFMDEDGLGRPKVLTELVAALLVPRGAKSGIFERDLAVDVDNTVCAEEEA